MATAAAIPTSRRKGEFSFDKKINEFKRAATALEFAPDGAARGVKFLSAEFKNKLGYTIKWTGGALHPTGSVVPS